MNLKKDNYAYVILVRGKRIITKSGKNVWSSIGAAKNAFNNHLRCVNDLDQVAWDADDKFEDIMTDEFNSHNVVTKYKKEWIGENVSFITMKDYLKMMGRSK